MPFFDFIFFWQSGRPISRFAEKAAERSVIPLTPYMNSYDKSEAFCRRPRQSWQWQMRNKNHSRSCFPDKSLLESQIYHIICVFKLAKNTDNQRRLNAKKTEPAADLVAAVVAGIKSCCHLTVLAIAQTNGTSE